MKNLFSIINRDDMSRKNFGLSRSQFSEMLGNLKKGDDRLFQQVFATHFKECMTYLQKQYGANHEDAYDCTMDALLDFCDRLKRGKIQYGNLRFLFTKMAGQIYMRLQKSQQKLAPLETAPTNASLFAKEEMTPEIRAAFEKAWKQLGENCSQLLRVYFYNKVKLKDLAEESGKSEAAMRKQKQRCVTQLQSHFHRFYPSR